MLGLVLWHSFASLARRMEKKKKERKSRKSENQRIPVILAELKRSRLQRNTAHYI